MNRLKVGMLLFPDLTIQDFVGPYDVFVKVKEFEVIVVGKTKDPIQAEGGLTLAPTVSFEECPKVDILFVPGGRGINLMLKDRVFLDFLQKQATKARYITSVCTGSLLLAAAGLLKGRKATTHWRSLDLLRKFDVEVVEDRYVLDENIITGAGVTAGIDFGLALVAHIVGDNVAKLVQLMLEYDPAPPFNSGSPRIADENILQRAVELTSPVYEDRVKIIEGLNHKKD
ncbi:MAG TPA: DJ-1/PfpI family protein [Cyclobacteriaceae bacterium]|nr:DJ-1/PfpI family protein [Cyclobacteriaceae bacterium]